ncbi:class I SAM-dependent methyltransferase [Cellulophaga sp. HaHaR_3_176]|uniref:O-methyltransferase n=1 Tax=Cellulophaga sp. HaHaR_3_176 TaxID=1942464 RepID=UPI001C20130A|nr:class I SAM-dependent methyltransferase [Cellulophaga sp. HaHaR_3_176]QWX82662.1 class I SAM-dependent methyltransferase [Cellulophaga sp. HaHaR_3_176]
MNDNIFTNKPEILSKIEDKSKAIGFTMPSDLYVGSLLKTLVASKPAASILELGTGIGLSLAWMLDGMDSESTMISVDNDEELIAIAKDFFKDDKRLQLVCEDGSIWLKNYKQGKFDLVFADAWPGKYSEIDEVLKLVKVGGFYIIDDMTEQPNWPEGHSDNVDGLIAYLEKRKDFSLTKMNWSTGLIIATRVA